MTMVSGNPLLAQSLFQMLLARATWQDAKPPLLSRATSAQLRALIEVAAEVPITEGTVLVGPGDAPAVFQVVDGELRLETAGGATVILPGMTLGVADTLAGSAASARAVVTRSGRALRVDRDGLFAVLTDHIDLMQGVFSEVLALPRKELPGIAAQA
jgi:CRP-like cAMP-binding protein